MDGPLMLVSRVASVCYRIAETNTHDHVTNSGVAQIQSLGGGIISIIGARNFFLVHRLRYVDNQLFMRRTPDLLTIVGVGATVPIARVG